jgi:hypothetical protein
MLFVIGLGTFLRAVLFGSAAIALDNLALRHQLRVLQRSVRRLSFAKARPTHGATLPALTTDHHARGMVAGTVDAGQSAA